MLVSVLTGRAYRRGRCGPETTGALVVDPERVRGALFALRLLTGGTVGLEVGDVAFVRFAAGVEILFGLLLISGALPQLTVLAAGIPFNATLFFLGATELIGHPLRGSSAAAS